MERRNLEAAALNYSYLRGLFLLPAGLMFILAAVGNWGLANWAFLLALVALGAACLPIARYYNENYGRLHPSTGQQVRASAVTAAGVAVILGGSLLLRSRASWSLNLPVNALAVSVAVSVLIFYAIGVGLKAHHTIIWGAVLLAGALPVWNGADPSNIGLVIIGAAHIVCGVFDHRLFVHTFGSPKNPVLEDSDVAA